MALTIAAADSTNPKSGHWDRRLRVESGILLRQKTAAAV
jgi:hypothetical protein